MVFFYRSQIFQETKTSRAFNSYCTDDCLKHVKDGRLMCRCGEPNDPIHEWAWEQTDSTNVKIYNDSKEVLFHPIYSSGTALVRGNTPFQPNRHYYWEFKMLSKIYGTDVMIGVGTARVSSQRWKHTFVSLLGLNSQSWGYSFRGHIKHNNLGRKYGRPFGRGSIIGLHLDMCKGTLEFYFNRKPLGIAFDNLKNVELYPMISSTAANSLIRTVCCLSLESNLQMMCLEKIIRQPAVLQQYKNIPGFNKIHQQQYFWMVSNMDNPQQSEKEKLEELDRDVTMSLFQNQGLFQKYNLHADFGDYSDDDEVDDSYQVTVHVDPPLDHGY